ncbi:MAG: hypothetical protein JNK48_28240 [Bryobacterales bacterium]|nr:hypothetical protein [Bryobacterales bacterium]
MRGNAAQLTEQHIGQAVFGKPAGYSPTEDSSVRASARLLRLRLHEYYDLYGRAETLVLTLPKGSYAPGFEAQAAATSQPAAAPPAQSEPSQLLTAVIPAPEVMAPGVRRWLPRAVAMGLAGILCLVCGYLLGSRPRPALPAAAETALGTWPLSEVFAAGAQTQIVVSDVNYGVLSILGGRALKIDEYTSPSYPQNLLPGQESVMTPREQALFSHLARTSFVSYADARMTHRIVEAAVPEGPRRQITVRSARDLKTRELAEGNFLFLGSPSSNLWVSLFEERLNFVEHKPVGEAAYFVNRHPQPGEDAKYRGIPRTGSNGVEYAAIALLPGESQRGKVLILQGTQQEGTEAAGLLLTTEQGRSKLRAALRLGATADIRNVHFEALIRSRVLGGAAAQTDILATRMIR